jgi:hypothetical protein
MYHVLDDDLIEVIAEDQESTWLVLDVHPAYQGYWEVQALTNTFVFDFDDLIGPHRVISPAELEVFLKRADELEYKVAFGEDPLEILKVYDHLNDLPEVSIESTLEGTVNGLLPYQVQGYNALRDKEGAFALWDTGPQPLDASILTPQGWVDMGSLVVGDQIMGSDGEPHRVTDVKPQGIQEVFRLTFKDGSMAESTAGHLWGFNDNGGNYYVRSLQEYLDAGLRHTRGDSKWYVDRVAPIRFDEYDLPVDPYLLGVLLGDGSLTASVPQVYSQRGEIIPLIEPLLPSTIRVSKYGPKHFALVNRHRGRVNGLKESLQEIGVWGHVASNKFIPQRYLIASVADRLSLLQGLLDTDGCAEIQGASISSVSQELAQQIGMLVRSLGGRAHISKTPLRDDLPFLRGQVNKRHDIWRVRLSLPPYMEYFRLERKTVKRRPDIGRNALTSVESIGLHEVQCISVDSEDGRYVTGDYVLTHNTGKTVLAISLAKYHILKRNFDVCFVFVKAHNKTNTARAFERLGGLKTYIVEGTPKKREDSYIEIFDAIDRGEKPIIILNYEKVRDDFCYYEVSENTGEWLPRLREEFESLFTGKVFIIWDEAPTKMKNRTSKLYKGIVQCLYRTNAPSVNWERRRPQELRQIALTATPIEVDPQDYFNVERVLNGGRTLGTVKDFLGTYASVRDPMKPDRVLAWRDLDDIALRASHFTHMVDKTHPDIASQFPTVIEEVVYIDWDDQDRKVYDKLTKELVKKVQEDDGEEDGINIFAAISVMQMLCDAPTMVNDSAALREAYDRITEECGTTGPPEGSKAALALIQSLGTKLTNDRHTKIKEFKSILTERHPDDKVLVYTTFNNRLIPLMGDWLDDWGVSYVTYGGSQRQRQEAEDMFREDASIRVFLSSDMGSDSLNLEMAQVGINFDLPWNWSRRTQRVGRNNRRTSTFNTLYWYDLIMAHSVEDRKQKLILKKKAYHDGLTGRAAGEAASARMTKGDLLAVLSG